jgi:hypothetical protein
VSGKQQHLWGEKKSAVSMGKFDLSKGSRVLQSLKWLLEVPPLCYHPKQFVAFSREMKE